MKNFPYELSSWIVSINIINYIDSINDSWLLRVISLNFQKKKTYFWGHHGVELVGAQSTPTQLRPFARHLIGKMVIQAAHLLITIRTAQ